MSNLPKRLSQDANTLTTFLSPDVDDVEKDMQCDNLDGAINDFISKGHMYIGFAVVSFFIPVTASVLIMIMHIPFNDNILAKFLAGVFMCWLPPFFGWKGFKYFSRARALNAYAFVLPVIQKHFPDAEYSSVGSTSLLNKYNQVNLITSGYDMTLSNQLMFTSNDYLVETFRLTSYKDYARRHKHGSKHTVIYDGTQFAMYNSKKIGSFVRIVPRNNVDDFIPDECEVTKTVLVTDNPMFNDVFIAEAKSVQVGQEILNSTVVDIIMRIYEKYGVCALTISKKCIMMSFVDHSFIDTDNRNQEVLEQSVTELSSLVNDAHNILQTITNE